MDLKPGDVLVLDQRPETPLVGSIAGTERLIGRAGHIGRHAAFLIERMLPIGKGPQDKE
jgi:flagellar motor switch protein FliM